MSRSSSGREFLAASAGAALAGFASTSAASAPGPPIIDTHVHLWDLKTFRLSWLEGAPTLNCSFLWDDYRQASAGLNIVKAIYMEVDVDPSQQDQGTLGAPLATWVEALREVVRERKSDEQRKLFHDNAERVYRLR